MRDVFCWGSAMLFLLAALHTVAVRGEVYADARVIGHLEEELVERRRRNDNLALLRERLASPVDLRRRAEAAGIIAGAENGDADGEER
jgi:hypothetical protein